MTIDYKLIYRDQVDLILKILPLVATQSCFALKGGTAINLFIQDMPRLSVDIDLTYLPIEPRPEALLGIEKSLENISHLILQKFPHFSVTKIYTKRDRVLAKLSINSGLASVKIEPNLILRGSLLPIIRKDLTKAAEKMFNRTLLDIPILSTEEIYAGKICAALDRQHPRDLFDVKLLYDHGGLTENLLDAFVVYLASSPRPISEMLKPNLQNIRHHFDNDFLGMTNTTIDCDTLEKTRERLITDINNKLTTHHRHFLLSVKQGEPDWSKISINNLNQFPALKWKILNIQKMEPSKKQHLFNKLSCILNSQ